MFDRCFFSEAWEEERWICAIWRWTRCRCDLNKADLFYGLKNAAFQSWKQPRKKTYDYTVYGSLHPKQVIYIYICIYTWKKNLCFYRKITLEKMGWPRGLRRMWYSWSLRRLPKGKPLDEHFKNLCGAKSFSDICSLFTNVCQPITQQEAVGL